MNLFFIGTAYSTAIGGAATLIGTGTNLAFRGIYESEYPNAPEIGFGGFMLFGVANAFIVELFVWLFLNIIFAGMFRPNSQTAQQIQLKGEAIESAEKLLRERANALGKMDVRESLVLGLFVSAVLLWFFRSPGFMPGWPKLFTNLKVHDASPGILIILLMFMLPLNWDWLTFCSTAEDQRPKRCSPSLITWKLVHEKVPWGLCFLLGAGYTLSAAGHASGMSSMIGRKLDFLSDGVPPLAIVITVCLLCQCMTEFTSNMAIANIVLPIVSELSRRAHIHPLFLMLPAVTNCSYAFMTPVGTPPNAYIAGIANIRTSSMVIT